ncbi:DNA polymerase III subunit delta' [Immundisolibacter sp.]|uniref:DNA polymerase III subunit delta' n=1 Tax=Immundisolibacter sp. TaxID=1934948 RepID=UPI0035699969
MNQLLPWHTAQWETVTSARAAGRLHHALLATGPAGVGKAQFLAALAAWLLCSSPNGDQPCGACRACLQNTAGTHPDCAVLSPDPLERAAFSTYPGQRCQMESSRKKPATVISVDQVRELSTRLVTTAHYGHYKLAVLLPADALNLAAANALLKLLEEPPDNTVFLLLSQRPAFLPATLRSRCQMLRFSAPPTSQARAWLNSDGPAADLALELGGGAPLQAAKLLAQDLETVWNVVCVGLAGLLAGTADPMRLARDWLKLPQQTLDTALYGWLRRALRNATGAPDAKLGNTFRTPPPQRLQAFASELEDFLRLREHPLSRDLALERLLYPLWVN